MQSPVVRPGPGQVELRDVRHASAHERCAGSGPRRAVTGGTTRRADEVTTRERRPLLTALGWVAIVLMVVLITVLTVVLAGMLLVVSVWLTVAVPLVVLVLVVGVTAYARRG